MHCLRLLFPAVNSYRLVASTTERLHIIKFSVSVIEFLAFWLCDRTQVIRRYNPPLNFRMCSLDKTHHVVQNRTAGICRPFSLTREKQERKSLFQVLTFQI